MAARAEVLAGEEINIDAGIYDNYGSTSTTGGVLHNEGTVNIEDGAEFNFNTGRNGGVISNQGTVLAKGEIGFNRNMAAYTGGAFYNRGNITFDGSTQFTENVANYGGSIYNFESGNAVFNGNAKFIRNQARSDGGAISHDKYGRIIFNEETTFSENQAGSYGGGIVNRGVVEFNKDVTFTNNTAGYSGGAIYNINPRFEVASVTGNAAALSDNAEDDNGTVVFNGNAVFEGNSARQGGAIYNDYGTLSLVDSSFEDSYVEASGNVCGGAIYNENGIVNISAVNKDVLFQGNYTKKSDGDVPESVLTNLSLEEDFSIMPAEEEGEWETGRIGFNNAIYSERGSLNLAAINGHNVRFEDEIDGSGYNVSIGGVNGDGVHGVLNDYANTRVYSRDDLGLSEVVFNSKVLRADDFDLSGIALTAQADLGTTPISSLPYVLTFMVPLSFGMTTFIINMLFVVMQKVILRGDFKKTDYLQIVVTALFGFFVDLGMYCTAFFKTDNYPVQVGMLVAGSAILAMGVLLETVADVSYVPGEGVVKAIAYKTHK